MDLQVIQNRVLHLKSRVSALTKAYGSIENDEELASIFARYNAIREQLVQQRPEYFGDLIPRKPGISEEGSWVIPESVEILLRDIAEIESGLELLDSQSGDEQLAIDTQFWSRRTKPVQSDDWLELSRPVVLSVIARLIRGQFFAEKFGNTCYYCGRACGLDDAALNQSLSEYLPGSIWPPKSPNMDQLFDLIEFFYRNGSEPIEWEACDTDRCPVRFSGSRGRSKFTAEMNDIFVRFGATYRLCQGRMSRVGSPVIETLFSDVIVSDDAELQQLIDRAVSAFRDRTDRRVEAAEIICKAFEHLKHKYGKDSKKGAEALIQLLVENEQQAEKMSALWLALTNTAHSFVRHSTPIAPSTSDVLLAEYIFIQFYSAIYLIHRKLGLMRQISDRSAMTINLFEAAKAPVSKKSL